MKENLEGLLSFGFTVLLFWVTYKYPDAGVWIWGGLGLYAMGAMFVHSLTCPNRHYGFRCVRKIR